MFGIMSSDLCVNMENVKHVLCLVLMLNLSFVCSQYDSPCPDIFSYENDGRRIYGKILLRGRVSVSQLELQVYFTVEGSTSKGSSIVLENANFALQGYNQGNPMRYWIRFPESSSLPRVIAILVNGNLICSGSGVSQQNRFITNFSLKHTSYLSRLQQFGFIPQPLTMSSLGTEQIQNQSDQGGRDIFKEFFNPRNNTQITTRPNRPTDEEIATYFNSNNNPKEDSFDRISQSPTISNRYPNEPEFQQPTEESRYEEPVTAPTRPLSWPIPTTQQNFQDVSYDVSGVNTVQPPKPVFTKRPVQPRPESQIECGTRATDKGTLALIFGGNNYVRGEVPWLVAIYKKKRGNVNFVCGGTLVTNRHIVTAAHCMWLGADRSSFTDIVVRVGVHNLGDWADGIAVTRSLIDASLHNAYNAATLENDIAVLTLSKPFEFNDYIRPVCLWVGDNSLERVVGSSGLVAGWGEQRKHGGIASEPKLVYLPIVSTEMCRSGTESFNDLTSNKTFCAGDRDGSGPCRGDSGSGLYLFHEGKWRLRGVVSVSLQSQDDSCNLDEYVVFTDTAQYLPWLSRVLQKQYFDN